MAFPIAYSRQEVVSQLEQGPLDTSELQLLFSLVYRVPGRHPAMQCC